MAVKTVLVGGFTVLTCAVMILAVLFKSKVRIFSFKIDTYWIITSVAATILLISGLLNPASFFTGLTTDIADNPMKILILFLSITFLSIFLDEINFFRYLANLTVKTAGKNQYLLFTALFLMISVLTLFTSNDVIILTFTPFLCYFAKYAGVNPIPYVFGEFIAANTWSMAFIIGNPTNIYLASSFGITFLEYLQVMIFPTLTASTVAFLLLLLIFRKQLAEPLHGETDEVNITDKVSVGISITLLAGCTVLLALSSYLDIDMWLVPPIFATALVAIVLILNRFRKQKPSELARTAKRVPWKFIPFLLSMFAISLALSNVHITEMISSVLNRGDTVFTYGLTSFVTANLINNIPMSMLYAFILGSSPSSMMTCAMYATVIGSNLGAFLTPIGSLAGIMWISLLKESNVKFGFVTFIKYGTIVAIPTILTALLILNSLV
ncbi:MAG TPA: ArsB/NhaD family transporter [Methanocorpusculum sp.]|nr:ArsB/NhaD family transporter [Methanocorpusculum sp.]